MMPRFRPCAKKQGLDAEDVNKAHLEPSMVKSARPGGKLIDLGESRPLNQCSLQHAFESCPEQGLLLTVPGLASDQILADDVASRVRVGVTLSDNDLLCIVYWHMV